MLTYSKVLALIPEALYKSDTWHLKSMKGGVFSLHLQNQK